MAYILPHPVNSETHFLTRLGVNNPFRGKMGKINAVFSKSSRKKINREL
jgi:hypothetical protein